MASQAKGIPPFLTKLYEMTNEVCGQDECFKWSDDGLSFWVSNAEQFSRDVLPSYFKHNNYASFVRQLNLYGFRRSTEPKGKVAPGTYMVEVFRHPHFVRGRKDLLQLIHRKSSIPSAAASTAATPFQQVRRIKMEPEDTDDASSSSGHMLSHSPAPGMAIVEASSPMPPRVLDEVTQLKERTMHLEREVAMLRTQNQILAGQQQQQAIVVQSLVNLMAKFGISLTDNQEALQQTQTAEPQVMLDAYTSATAARPEVSYASRGDAFSRDTRQFFRNDSIDATMFSLDDDDGVILDMDLSSDTFGLVGPISS